MSDAEIAELAKSIRANGQRLAITLHEGKILDGRNRYRACQQVHIKPWTAPFNGNDPVQFAKDINEQRRHETASQRALIAAKLANIQHGDVASQNHDGPNGPSLPLVSISKAAKIMKVGTSPVKRGKKILAEATPEVVAKVEAGEMTLGAAVKTIEAEVEIIDPKPKVRKYFSQDFLRLKVSWRVASATCQREFERWLEKTSTTKDYDIENQAAPGFLRSPVIEEGTPISVEGTKWIMDVRRALENAPLDVIAAAKSGEIRIDETVDPYLAEGKS
jgi:hypothetical protein